MNIYLLEQDLVNGYDTYDAIVVAAESTDEARKIHPSRFCTHNNGKNFMGTYDRGGEYIYTDNDWVKFSDIHKINVTILGEAHPSVEKGVILASFNAG